MFQLFALLVLFNVHYLLLLLVVVISFNLYFELLFVFAHIF